MENSKTKRKYWKLLLALVFVVSQLFTGRLDAYASGTPALDITNLSLSVGQTQRLQVSNADEVTWTSSRRSVATVSSNGLVRARKAGRTTITATVGSRKLKCYVVVNNPSEQKKDILVAFFSQTETTTAVAKQIHDLTGGDILRIRPKTRYTSNYDRLVQIAQRELENDARPAVTALAKNMDSYDVIYIGFPIWWHTAPMTVGTFLESYDLTGKTIYPVLQSASMDRSQYAQSVEFIRECAKGATVDDGIFTRDGETIQSYVDGIVSGR